MLKSEELCIDLIFNCLKLCLNALEFCRSWQRTKASRSTYFVCNVNITPVMRGKYCCYGPCWICKMHPKLFSERHSPKEIFFCVDLGPSLFSGHPTWEIRPISLRPDVPSWFKMSTYFLMTFVSFDISKCDNGERNINFRLKFKRGKLARFVWGILWNVERNPICGQRLRQVV